MTQIVLTSLIIGASPLMLALAFMACEKLVVVVLSLFEQLGSEQDVRPMSRPNRPKAIGRRNSEANAVSAKRPCPPFP